MTADALDRRALLRLSEAEACADASARSGEMPSLAAVYDAHVDYVVRCLRSLGLSDGTLDDAVQDVFLVVHDKLAEFDGKAQLRTWLYAIVIRVARRHRARFARARAREVEAEGELVWDALEHELEARRQVQLARAALEALDQEKREVFVLIEIEQMSAPEVAEITGVRLNTVYSRLRAARSAFEHEVDKLKRSQARRES
jgi:RNA polymerase sigma-70 factor (ECF subfamily)